MREERTAPAAGRSRWSLAGEMLTQPYPLSFRLVATVGVMMVLVPFYLVIPGLTRGQALHMPELALDRWMGLQPAWSLVYLSYLLTPFLPMLVVRQEEHIWRTVLAWVMVWSIGYVCFLMYPTILPRSDLAIGEGFFAWILRGIYQCDPPRNSFPSLHVATAFVAALACYRVHRGVGIAATLWAALIAVSTVFTKQHYVADAIAGIVLAYVAYGVFLLGRPGGTIPALDRHAAPVLMLGLIGVYGLVVAGFWIFYVTQVR